MFSDVKTITEINTYKGWAFVLITGLLIYLLLRNPLKKLRKSEEKYSQIVNTASEGILVVDKDLKIRFANARISELLQYEPSDILGQPFEGFIVKSELLDHEAKVLNYKQGFSERYERHFIKKDGTSICMLVSSTVINDEVVGFSGFYAMLTDISELRKFQDELMQHEVILKQQNEEYITFNEELAASNQQIKKMYEDLKVAKEKAEESDNLKSAFLANMSHEIRTPLNGIVGFANILVERELSQEKKARYSDIIVKSSNQLLSIINDILDFSKIETGQMNISLDVCDLNLLMDDMYTFFSGKAAEKQLQYKVIKAFSKPEGIIKTDRLKLNQILTNLVSNAFKFTQTGSIIVSYELDGSDILFTIKDTGIGIPPKDHEQVFHRFRQADNNSKKIYGGTGLGLSISKALVEMLDGRIWMQSTPGIGTIFYFTIPYIRMMHTNSVKVSEPGNMPTLNLKQAAILVVEDEAFNFVYLKEVLTEMNALVIFAGNGTDAIEICRNNAAIQLVLMDIKLPDMDGYEATKIIKKIRPELTVIAQTAYALGIDNNRAKEAGCSDYIAKPITKNVLIAALAKFF
jgi:PAS domain S-box-containing protein